MTWPGSCARPTSSVFHCTDTPRSRKLVAHDPLVVVLAEDEDERIGRDAFPASPSGTRAILRPCAQMLAPVPRLPSSSARSTMPSLA